MNERPQIVFVQKNHHDFMIQWLTANIPNEKLTIIDTLAKAEQLRAIRSRRKSGVIYLMYELNRGYGAKIGLDAYTHVVTRNTGIPYSEVIQSVGRGARS